MTKSKPPVSKTPTGEDAGGVSDAQVERFQALFSGFSGCHGRTRITGTVNDKGKTEGKSFTAKGAAPTALYREHLEGKSGLGIIMLREDDTVTFAAIDYDSYTMDHVKAEAKIRALKLPLVLCRSKSGGGHLYIFTTAPVAAKVMRERLSEYTAMLGMSSKTEQFPKQTTRGSPEDIGSWINLPYFDAERTVRYATIKGKAVSLEEFLRYAEAHRVTPEQLEQPAYAVASDESDLFYEGPPCLAVILAQGGLQEGTRNDGMVAVITYLKKRYPDTWKDYVDAYNQQMAGLKSTELVQLTRSMEKKDYRYRCNASPLKDVCQRRECIKKMYGVGEGDPESQGVALSGLTRYDPVVETLPDGTEVLDGDEPIWMVEVNGKRVTLTNAQLYSRDAFNQACMAQANALPIHMPPARWLKYLSTIVATADVIKLPSDAGPSGQLWVRVMEFCVQKANALTKEEVFLGKPYRQDGRVFFRSSDLFKYLDSRRISVKSPQQLWLLLQRRGAEKAFWNLKGKGVNVWSLPLPDGPAPQMEELGDMGHDEI